VHNFFVRNVSEALYLGVQALQSSGRLIKSRNGDVLEFDTPVCTTYTHSRERVLFYKQRDANPFFHLMESFWMLAGRNDVEWISQFNGRINTYSDDGKSFHGAYGYRWRSWFGYDQLERAIERLSAFSNDRRTVIGMWDANYDLVTTNDGKDYPCNTQIFFSERDGKLNMTVVNRSNDMIWGAYGANAVHMSVLLEYMAARLELGVGRYYQVSNNLHAYVEQLDKLKGLTPEYENYLTIGKNQLSYNPPALVDDHICFDEELEEFFNDDKREKFKNSYLEKTAVPMKKSWKLWKNKKIKEAIKEAEKIDDRAWKIACVEWLQRRMKGETNG
jgi:thymidylate synthase